MEHGNGLVSTPLYVQLQGVLKHLIATGDIKGILPNEATLAAQYKVSAGTMRKALDSLEAQGVVIRRQGRGTFVREDPWQGLPPEARLLLGLLGVWEPMPNTDTMKQTNGHQQLTAGGVRSIIVLGGQQLAAFLEDQAEHGNSHA